MIPLLPAPLSSLQFLLFQRLCVQYIFIFIKLEGASPKMATAELVAAQCCNAKPDTQKCRIVIIGLCPSAALRQSPFN